MTQDHAALDALRAADRPRPLTDDARRRVEDRMLVAHEQALAEERSGTTDAPPSVLDLAAPRPDRSARRRLRPLVALVAAAAILAVALVTAVGVGDDPGDRVDVAGLDDAGLDPDVVLAVRAWCRADLTELRAALEPPDGVAAADHRRATLSALATAADGLSEVLTELRAPDGARRLQEVARISGEAALLRDGAATVTEADVEALVAALDAELVLLSGGGAACELQS